MSSRIMIYLAILISALLFSADMVFGYEDSDGNGFRDQYEISIIQNFCPALVLDSRDYGVWPEPIEIMGPIWFSTWTLEPDYMGEALTYWIQNGENYSQVTSDVLISSGPVDASCGTILDLFYSMPHFDYGGSAPDAHCDDFVSPAFRDQPAGWYDTYQNGYFYDFSDIYIEFPPGSDFPTTIYAHPFKDGDNFIIQYFFFYPFNNWVNNHEGDWEHINVVITSDDPNIAEISRVVYYFHKNFMVCEVAQSENPDEFDFYVIDGSHPVVFIGGWGSVSNSYYGVYGEGAGSHGCYPIYGEWENVTEIPLVGNINEFVHISEGGITNFYQQYLPWNYITMESRDNKYGVVLLKETNNYDYEDNPGMSWFPSNLYWGYPAVKSAGTENEIIDFLNLDQSRNLGHIAPVGPRHGTTWNRTTTGGVDFEEYQGSCLTFNRASDAAWIPPLPPPPPWDHQEPEVIITYPNGGEFYETKQTITITWHVEDDFVDYVECDVTLIQGLDLGNGNSAYEYLDIGSNIPVDSEGNGNISYFIAPGESATYELSKIKVKAIDPGLNEATDRSDDYFTIERFPKNLPEEPTIPGIQDDKFSLFRAMVSETQTALFNPNPNPFNPSTNIHFILKKQAPVSLNIYSVTGKIIKTFYDNVILTPGDYFERWNGINNDGKQVTSGIYFLNLRTYNYSETKRMILLR